MSPSLSLFILGLGLISVVRAQSPVWGQCGGNGWTGSTACASGFVTSMRYSQCVPSSSAPSSTGSAPPASTPSSSVKANYWFSFGDSYTATAFSPDSTPPQPSNPMGNPSFPGGTATGGPNWIDYDTVTFNNSLVLTWNYAYGGATIDANLAPPYTPTVLSLTDQVNEFLNGAAKKPASAPWTGENSLFSVWIGINDLSWSWWQTGDRLAYSDTLLDAEFALIQKLYNVGARNFLFLNVPPFQRSPYSLEGSNTTAPILQGVIEDFNTKLVQRVQDLKANNTGVTTFLWDSYEDFNKILDNPTQYGFRDATAFGSGDDLFWG
ncbi:hypothetical protein K435DRAFT_662833 [Dendrothele bispora CBS 962.96]|uniref:CBM1 domain-containing protein n=1 Tax=Dendrothele bispora (strain CBS 962.96) TaxID=1314807 RepID=A0A4S8M5C8_DENBC|nr:hypothetical protein K435DRAFT_662833 [Dendrothele bispora CBS 962.96]